MLFRVRMAFLLPPITQIKPETPVPEWSSVHSPKGPLMNWRLELTKHYRADERIKSGDPLNFTSELNLIRYEMYNFQ